MNVVSNASPLIALHRIWQLDLLANSYDTTGLWTSSSKPSIRGFVQALQHLLDALRNLAGFRVRGFAQKP